MQRDEREVPPFVFGRIAKLMIYLGFACLFIGFSMFLGGQAINVFLVSQVGAFVLLAGIFLLALRVFLWIVDKIIEHGAKGMTPEEIST